MNLIDIRQFFAEEIRAVANIQTDALATAFAKVLREHFLGPGPWQIASPDARGSSIGGTAIGTTLLHAPTFPLTSRLPSICSALTKGVSLFADFVSTTRLSDFLRPFIIVVRPWTSRCDPGMRAWVVAGFPGSRAGCVRACLGPLTSRDTNAPCQSGALVVAFPFSLQGRHPEFGFRGSIPSLHFPLSTLRLVDYSTRRMTRGRHGWLNL